MKKLIKNQKGFTLVELMISVGIFAIMTGFLLAKYGTFNQGVLLTNLAYDVALTIRNAQSYGLNVKSSPVGGENEFNYPYGVHFSTGASFVFFADFNSDGRYSDNEKISVNNIKRGSVINDICLGTGPSDCVSSVDIDGVDITFKRPDPNAIIRDDSGTASYAEITLLSTDGSIKKVVVRSTGQIAITN